MIIFGNRASSPPSPASRKPLTGARPRIALWEFSACLHGGRTAVGNADLAVNRRNPSAVNRRNHYPGNVEVPTTSSRALD
jgi:hypothetical protein